MDCVTVTLGKPILRGEFLQTDNNIVLIPHNIVTEKEKCTEQKKQQQQQRKPTNQQTNRRCLLLCDFSRRLNLFVASEKHSALMG